MTKAVSILKKKIDATYKAINEMVARAESSVENGTKSINDALGEISVAVSEMVESRFGFDFNTLTFIQGLITMAERYDGNTAGDMTEAFIMSLMSDASNGDKIEVTVKTIRKEEEVDSISESYDPEKDYSEKREVRITSQLFPTSQNHPF